MTETLPRTLEEAHEVILNMRSLLDERLRKEAHLKGQLRKMTEGELVDPEVEAIGELYRQVMGKTDRWIFDDKRRRMTKASLRLAGFQRLENSIKGHARFPYVVNKARVATAPPGTPRSDSLELCIRDAERIEYGEGLLARDVKPAPQPKRRGKVWDERTGRCDDPIINVLHALDALNLTWRASEDGRSWNAQCPAHDDKFPSLAVTRSDNGHAMLFCRASCSQADVLMGLNIPASWLFAKGSYERDPQRRQVA